MRNGMRVAVALATLLVLATPAAWAQTSVGLFGSGYRGEWSGFDEDYGDVLQKYMGPGAGFVVERPLSNNVSLRFQPNAIFKGQKLQYDFDGSGYSSHSDLTFKLTYVELPVMLKLTLGSGSIRPYLFGGPAVGYLALAKEKEVETTSYEGGSSVVRDYNDTTTDEYSKVELSLGVGAGLRAGRLFLEVQYLAGLTSIAPDEGDPAIKNTGFRANVGFFLN